jgi:hypothetical protein
VRARVCIHRCVRTMSGHVCATAIINFCFVLLCTGISNN